MFLGGDVSSGNIGSAGIPLDQWTRFCVGLRTVDPASQMRAMLDSEYFDSVQVAPEALGAECVAKKRSQLGPI